MIAEIKKEIAGLEITRKSLRDFGLLFCTVFCIAAGVMYWKGNLAWKWPIVGGAGFLLAGIYAPMALRRLFRLWMTLAVTMGWFMTRLILTMAFFVIMTPMGWLLKVMGKDLLDEKIRKESQTYWKKHDRIGDKDQYKKQF